MTNGKILDKALKLAQDNGYKGYIPERLSSIDKSRDGDYNTKFINKVIFNHDFAKALWGEEHHDNDDYQPYNWCYHLKRMVIAEDPIKYLGENI